MITFSDIEFYGTPAGDVMIKENGRPLRLYLQETDQEFTSRMIAFICEFYTEAFEYLSELYSESHLNKHYYEYLIIHRFIRCNFREYDNFPDIKNGIFHFEHVKCPIRGECIYENRICYPKFNSKMTERELQVMQLLYESYKIEAIAAKLFISPNTVETHKSNALKKLQLHSLAEFNVYAAKNNLFDNRRL